MLRQEIAGHASVLAFIEKRFLSRGDRDADEDADDEDGRPHLTARDRHASTLEDLFDFDGAPSMTAPVPLAPPGLDTDPGCPFTK